MNNRHWNTKRLTTMAMLTAIAFVIALICHFIMPPLVENPPLKLDLKDTIIVIAGYMMGPLTAALISVVVSLIEMLTISSTGIIGFLMNALQSCAFACTAAFIYKKLHTKNGALISLLCGTVTMTIAMILWNWFVTPLYLGAPREMVEALLLPVFLPFNLIKGGLNTALVLFLYKPIVNTLRKSHLLPESAPASGVQTRRGTRLSLGIYLTAAVLFITCVLMALILAGVL